MQNKQKPNRLDYFINLGLASIAGLSGCVSLVVIMGALLLGYTLDLLLDTRPLIMIIAIVLSVPLAVWLMVQIAFRSAKAVEKRQWGIPEESDTQS